MATVYVIILTRNRRDDLIECIGSVLKATYANKEVIVVDNASTDGTEEAIKELFPRVELIETGENLGFARGNNIGIRRALEKGADFILLLNDDTVVDPPFIDELLRVAERDESIGVVGPRVYYYSDPKRLWATGDQDCIGKMDDGTHEEIKEVPWVVGCAFFMRRQVAEKAGLLDEEMFLYCEEDEYCARIRKAGFRMYYAPKSVVYHKASLQGDHLKPYQVYYNCRNSILVRRKKYMGLRFYASMANYLLIVAPKYAYRHVRAGRNHLLPFVYMGVRDGVLWCLGLKPAGQNKDLTP